MYNICIYICIYIIYIYVYIYIIYICIYIIYIYIYILYIYIYIYIYSYIKLAWVGFKPMTTEFRSDALTDWGIRRWVQLALRDNFVQLLQFHPFVQCSHLQVDKLGSLQNQLLRLNATTFPGWQMNFTILKNVQKHIDTC